jgi:hypothetical protein
MLSSIERHNEGYSATASTRVRLLTIRESKERL